MLTRSWGAPQVAEWGTANGITTVSAWVGGAMK